ncbi:cyclin N-terminal domain-containing protein 1-like [Homarus americanus]|uniref:cyclin N-terminal domain-containing protein 1-like n=1 Tax=Homarus americanus TaxID=6706 RepID=UPI001C47D836|nr:cyclin N-terminal domain-containing protein 1-like [Homarus americanus]
MEKHVQEMMHVLLAENQREKQQVHPFLTVLHVESAMFFIWQVIDFFKLSAEVRYIAFDIFQRFMLGYTESLLDHVVSITAEGRQRNRLIKEMEKQLKEQAPLKATICVMIASKIVTHKTSLSTLMAQRCLKHLKMSAHINDIKRSEISILKQLDWRCHRTSSLLEYIGLLISVAGLWEGDGAYLAEMKRITIRPVPLEELYEMSTKLLDMVHLNHERVYQDLYTSLTGLAFIPNKHKTAFGKVVADRLLLAGSVVASAAFVLRGLEKCSTILQELSIPVDNQGHISMKLNL